MAYATNITMLDELDLSEETHQQSRGSGMSDREERTQKFIRQAHRVPRESGMVEHNHVHSHAAQQPDHYHAHGLHNQNEVPYPCSLSDRIERGESPSCLRVSDHVSECPMCSKFFNPDKTIYIIVIIVLSLMCLLLLKRVLDL